MNILFLHLNHECMIILFQDRRAGRDPHRDNSKNGSSKKRVAESGDSSGCETAVEANR